MKQDKVERCAVPENRLERFMGVVYSLVEPFGVEDIPEVFHYVELLGQAIERQIAESKFNGVPQNTTTKNRKQFISIFKNRYLHLTDLEYSRTITGIDGKMINQLVKTLEENGFEVDEYLKWLFDTFLEENPKFCPPTMKFCCGNFVSEKFLFDHKDVIKKRKDDQLKKKEALDLISRSRVLMRHFSEEGNIKNKIVEVLKNYRDGSIMIDEMRSEIESLEITMRNTQTEQK